jgi:hypothetical protein
MQSQLQQQLQALQRQQAGVPGYVAPEENVTEDFISNGIQ